MNTEQEVVLEASLTAYKAAWREVLKAPRGSHGRELAMEKLEKAKESWKEAIKTKKQAEEDAE